MLRHLRNFALAALAAASLLGAGNAQAAFPERPITLIVPWAAGGGTDAVARQIAHMLERDLKQPVNVVNRTGGSGVVGAAYAARATPDGYTLFANSLADTQNLHYLPVNYNPVDDFIQIGWIVDGPPLVLIINGNLPVKTLGEMLADAKANPNKYSVGTSGPASSPGLTLAQLNKAAQVQIQPVPYRGSGDAAAAAAGGAIQGAFTFYSQAKPLADDGKVRAVAVASPKRLEGWPEVPTFTEQGYKIDQRGFVGLATPANTPKPVVEFLSKHLNEVVQSAEFKKRMSVLGMAPPPATDNTPEKFDKFMRDEIARQGEMAEQSGQKLKPQQK